MEQVRELLLRLINPRRRDGVVVATNFTFCRIQPYKERAHPGYEFQGDTDGSREVPVEIDRNEVMWCIAMLLNLMGRASVNDQQRAYSITNLPPMVRVCL